MERIPSRNEFDVPHQVYEWFRELSDTVQKIENEDQDEKEEIDLRDRELDKQN